LHQCLTGLYALSSEIATQWLARGSFWLLNFWTASLTTVGQGFYTYIPPLIETEILIITAEKLHIWGLGCIFLRTRHNGFAGGQTYRPSGHHGQNV